MESNKQKNSFLTRTLSFVLLYSFIFTNIFAVGVFAATPQNETVNKTELGKFTSDLTDLAGAGRIRITDNFANETNQLIKSLVCDKFRHPVILDEKGKNQELVVEQLAARIAKGNVPANLRDKRIFKLETASLFSKARDNAEVSHIIYNVFNELAELNGKIILFVDELTNFVGNTQIINALAGLLKSGKLHIIGGSSQAAYSERIEKNAEVSALFAPLNISKMKSGNSENASTPSDDYDGCEGENISSELSEMPANEN